MIMIKILFFITVAFFSFTAAFSFIRAIKKRVKNAGKNKNTVFEFKKMTSLKKKNICGGRRFFYNGGNFDEYCFCPDGKHTLRLFRLVY